MEVYDKIYIFNNIIFKIEFKIIWYKKKKVEKYDLFLRDGIVKGEKFKDVLDVEISIWGF